MSLKYLLKNNLNLKNNYKNTDSNILEKIKFVNKNINTKFNTIETIGKIPREKILLNLKLFNNSQLKENMKNSNSTLFNSKSNKNFLKNESTLTKRLNFFSTNTSKIKNKIKIKDYIQLNSLFTLPSIDKKMNRYNSIKTLYPNKDDNLLESNMSNSEKNQEKNNKINKRGRLRLYLLGEEKLRLDKLKRNKKYDNIYSFMKLKYYEDVNERLEKKLRDDEFIDRGIKDKIIKMGKVGIFWKNVMEYCSPLLFEEKYKHMKKKIINSFSQEEKMNNNYKNKKNFLYTSMFRTKVIHNQGRNKKNY